MLWLTALKDRSLDGTLDSKTPCLLNHSSGHPADFRRYLQNHHQQRGHLHVTTCLIVARLRGVPSCATFAFAPVKITKNTKTATVVEGEP